VAYFNDAAIRLLGLPSAAEGQPIARFLPELDWDRVSAMDRTGGARVARHEFEINYPRPRFLHVYAAPLDSEKRGRSGVALILHDATEAREKTFAAIESERSQALTLLAASVAHEIGNPLNALNIHLQLLEREARKLKKLVPEIREMSGRGRKDSSVGTETLEIALKVERYLSVAKGEINRLDYIITQFLQAIRPQQPQLQPASLNDVVRETLEVLRPEIENRGLRVRENLAEKLPRIPIDPAQIKQVLVNLCKNAIQAMTRGGVLTLCTEGRDDGACLVVSDTGGGIPQEMLNRIFEPFYTTKKKGSGLGLMIVQRIVRDHGGRIQLESNVGKGTTFRIWLPLQERAPRLLGSPGSDISAGS
jgi:signal transduction histidine kinase